MPATLPSTSSLPKASTAAATASKHSSREVTSPTRVVDGAAGGGDGGGGLGQALGVHVVAEDRGALGGQADGGGPPDAGAGPGDQRDLAVEAALARRSP